MKDSSSFVRAHEQFAAKMKTNEDSKRSERLSSVSWQHLIPAAKQYDHSLPTLLCLFLFLFLFVLFFFGGEGVVCLCFINQYI